MIRTFDEAYDFVLEHKVVGILGSQKSPYPSLWDHVDLPERQEGEKGWGEKVTAVWTWKIELPATYPDEIFYGKVKGGDAVLMEMEYLKNTHYPAAMEDVSKLSPLARAAFAHLRIEPFTTGELRKIVMGETGCTKSRFETALKQLQISLNIARSNHPDDKNDRWLLFSEQYPEIVEH